MPMSRGDLVIAAAPAVMGAKAGRHRAVKCNPVSRTSVVICPMTSELVEADFRITIDPGPETGLRVQSQVMADKPVTIRRDRIGQRIGQLGAADMGRLSVALAFVIGLAD
jgi:mRNA interferase MazF